ncbi:MAG: hypothetical protein ABL870_05070 [Sediminibacterium sp.]
MQTAIKLCASHEIDPLKWNSCIANNANGLIYSQYQYLSQLTKNWSAIVIGDYAAILPLPWNQKWGIRYYQAIPFVQQLGLIGNIDKFQIPRVLELIKKYAKYGDLFFNYRNKELAMTVPTLTKTNLVLDLRQDYISTAKNYKKDLTQNLEKAKKHHPIYQTNTQFSNTLEIYQQQYGNRINWISQSDFQKLTNVLAFYASTKQCIIRELIDQTTEELLASAILLKDNKRLYLLINAITPKGRQQSSNHLLIDQIIHEFSESDLLLDFEGSEIPGVKDFYMNYNPIVQPYYHFHHNSLVWPFNLLKK